MISEGPPIVCTSVWALTERQLARAAYNVLMYAHESAREVMVAETLRGQ